LVHVGKFNTLAIDEFGVLSKNINKMVNQIDIEQKKLTQYLEDLENENIKIKTILNSISDSIVIIDLKNNCIIKDSNLTFE
jgi:nitrogen fixation/metabolism regulation signal transduction histidine kinase